MVNFRKECLEVLQRSATEGNVPLELYKARISARLEDLRDFMFEKGTRQEYQRKWHIKLGFQFPLGWNFGWLYSKEDKRFLGDNSIIFLSDILSQSLGVLNAEEQIEKAFGVRPRYDTYLISVALPNRIMQKD